MSDSGLVLVGLAMVLGLVGTIVPVLPGLPVIWLAGLVWAVAEGGAVAWVVLAVLTVLAVAGTAVRYVLAARSVRGQVPRSTVLVAVVGGVVGMFVVPIVGLPLGAIAGVYAAEFRRTRNAAASWASTKRLLKAFGIGMAIEVGAGLAMVLVWVAGVAAT